MRNPVTKRQVKIQGHKLFSAWEKRKMGNSAISQIKQRTRKIIRSHCWWWKGNTRHPWEQARGNTTSPLVCRSSKDLSSRAVNVRRSINTLLVLKVVGLLPPPTMEIQILRALAMQTAEKTANPNTSAVLEMRGRDGVFTIQNTGSINIMKAGVFF